MAMTIEIPDALRTKVDAYVAQRRKEFARYSIKDAILDGLRQLTGLTATWTQPHPIKEHSKPVVGFDQGKDEKVVIQLSEFDEASQRRILAEAGGHKAPIAKEAEPRTKARKQMPDGLSRSEQLRWRREHA